jgi:hypothetical protein
MSFFGCGAQSVTRIREQEVVSIESFCECVNRQGWPAKSG